MNKKTERQKRIEQEYRKQRKRIQSYVSSSKRRGYHLIKDVLPKIPKRITEGSVNTLKKITPKVIRESQEYVGYYSGIKVPATSIRTIRSIQKKERSLAFAQAIIDNLVYEISSLNNQYAEEYLFKWLSGFVTTYGLEESAELLESLANRGIRITVEEYDSEKTAIRKSQDFISETLMATGEYNEEGLSELFDELDIDYFE